MTILELYQRLREKGYQISLEQQMLIANGVGEKRDRWLKIYAEHDRRAVFQAWYANREHPWHSYLLVAHISYGRGEIEYAVDYILTHPEA